MTQRIELRAAIPSKHPGMSLLCLLAVLVSVGQAKVSAQERPGGDWGRSVTVDVGKNLERLIAEEDTDHDKKITVDDACVNGKGGEKRFWLEATDGKRYEVMGIYYLSNLLQQLKIAEDAGKQIAPIETRRVFERPVERTSRMIREVYWDDLTRRIDEKHLSKLFTDEKVAATGYHYLYVPPDDPEAFQYFSKVAERHPAMRLRVERLPEKITPQYMKDLKGKQGILSLALKKTPQGKIVGVPFVVPGGRYNEMYGWDSYFESLGLLVDDRVDLAKAMVENFEYQIKHYGKILNANRTYYLNRSQPPFFTSMALAVYQRLPKNAESKAWLKKAIRAAIYDYFHVWMNKDRLTETGLSRYDGMPIGPPPEVEKGHFDAVYKPFADERNLDLQTFKREYKAGEIKVPKLDEFFAQDPCVRESGHDTTYRWSWDGDRCTDFVTVDLNSLLYKIETDIGRTIEKEFGGTLKLADGTVETAASWQERAEKRKVLINKYLWDEKRGMYFDYDYKVKKQRYPYVSATTFYPMWAGVASRKQAESLVKNALPLLEEPGGIVASTEKSRGPISQSRPGRQWDYPNGWPPHQMLVWQGMLNYGFKQQAQRLAYRWLYTITRNAADYNGTVTEKLDVVKRSHDVFTEYGNVGTKFSYITKEGFGWTNASYEVGLTLLPQELRDDLDRLIPPEWLFE